MNQRLEALEIANRKRSTISRMKKQLNAGEVKLIDVLNHPDVGPAKISAILASQRGWGPVRTAALLDNVNVRPLTRVDKLTLHQKETIAKIVETGVQLDAPPTADELAELEVGIQV